MAILMKFLHDLPEPIFPSYVVEAIVEVFSTEEDDDYDNEQDDTEGRREVGQQQQQRRIMEQLKHLLDKHLDSSVQPTLVRVCHTLARLVQPSPPWTDDCRSTCSVMVTEIESWLLSRWSPLFFFSKDSQRQETNPSIVQGHDANKNDQRERLKTFLRWLMWHTATILSPCMNVFDARTQVGWIYIYIDHRCSSSGGCWTQCKRLDILLSVTRLGMYISWLFAWQTMIDGVH